MPFFISMEKTVESIVISVFFALMLCLSSYKILGILQASGYSNRKLLRWTKRRHNLSIERHLLLAMCCGLSTVVVALCFGFIPDWSAIIGLSTYAVFFVVYIRADSKIALRSPAVVTNRFKRLAIVLLLVYAIAAYILVSLINFADYVWENTLFTILKYGILAILPMLIVPLVCFANLIAKAYEIPHNNKHIKNATQRLKNARVTVVAITGSYGKTSVKNMLTQMLCKRYRVLSTPRSYNTPIGVSLTVNKNNISDYDIFVAEMGARNVGDIAELCKICPPDYSVITGICPQHYETFGSLDNIVKAKGEILSATKKSAIIVQDAYNLFSEYQCDKHAADCVADVRAMSDGTEFVLSLDENSKRVKTKLLGAHSAINLGVAAKTAYMLGVSFDDIVQVIESIDYIAHRLQLIKAGNINILDDGYNSNVKGAAAALEVLRSFDGRKIVVTPGLVELGVLEKEENAELGASLKGLDLIILVGTTLIEPIKGGYLAAGGSEERLIVKPTLADAQAELKAYLKDGDTVLFLNDLPDIY